MFIFRFPFSIRELVGILALAHKYLNHVFHEAALYFLGLPEYDFLPASKLRVAWHYGVDSWYDGCIQELLNPLHDRDKLTTEDINDLGSEISNIILDTRARIRKHQRNLHRIRTNVVHSKDCTDRGGCINPCAFQSALLFYINTYQITSGRDIFKQLSALDIPNFDPECRRKTLAGLELSGVLWKDDEYRADGINGIKKIVLNQNPPGPRPEPRVLDKDAGTNAEDASVP